MYLPNLKSVALPVLEIIEGTRKKLASPWIRPRSIISTIFHGLLLRWTLQMYLPPKLKYVDFSVPEIIGGTPKLGSPWIRLGSLFSKIFNGLLFGWTLLMYLPDLKSVAFSIPQIEKVPPKIGQCLDMPTVPHSLISTIFHGLLFGCIL